MISVDYRHAHRTAIAAAAGLIVVGLAAAIPAAAGTPRALVAGRPQAARIVEDVLFSVAATSTTNAWAVGFHGYGGAVPVIEHWDGQRWLPVPGAAVGPAGGGLNGVVALSATNVWAVGWNGSKALIEHWAGAKWRSVASPAVGGKNSSAELTAVSAASAKSIWAVGFIVLAHGWVPLAEHWNGTKWYQVPCPDPGGVAANDWLKGVAATKAGAWAVGVAAPGGVSHTLALAWAHGTWRRVPSPDPSGNGNGLNGISAAGLRVLAVGYSFFDLPADALTLAAHLAGSAFSLEATPDPGGANQLYGAAVTATGALAVGESNFQTLVLREQSGTWTTMPSPSWPSPGTSTLYAVTAVGSTAWAVGQHTVEVKTPTETLFLPRTVILSWNGTGWVRVPSPNP